MNHVIHTVRAPRRASGHRAGLVLAVIALALAAAPGCRGFMHKQTGGVMTSYAQEHMVPHMMASGDLSMACETGVSMGSFLMSFGRVTDHPGKAALITLLSAGMCAEADAWEAELRQNRAVRDGRASEARDALIARQRHHALAAERFYAAYQQLEGVFGTVGEGCPEFDDGDDLYYMLGLSAGMLALSHDRAGGATAGVSMDIPQIVGRAADCLDNDRWWKAPAALQSAVWALVPGASPEGIDPFEILEASSQAGEAHGVRLARAFQVLILDANGQNDALRAAVAAHAESVADTPSNPDWELLDSYADRMILHISDRIWTAERGHRTPAGALGTFWQPPPEPPVTDELFDDLFAPSEPDDGAATEETVP